MTTEQCNSQLRRHTQEPCIFWNWTGRLAAGGGKSGGEYGFVATEDNGDSVCICKMHILRFFSQFKSVRVLCFVESTKCGKLDPVSMPLGFFSWDLQ